MLIMSIAVPAQEPSITWTGSGTAEAPYEVSTAEELAAFRDAVNNGADYAGKTVALTADITLSDAWTPIGNKSKQFKGTFEGGGHCIKYLNVNINGDGYQYGDSYGGLFGYIGTGGTVQNLGVTGKVSVILPNNDAYAGGIAGRNKGTIKNCFTTVEVEAWGGNSYTDSYAGGIAGCNQANISNCYATGEISLALYAGGIAGDSDFSNDGTISYCYATGKVNNNQNAAGIAYKQASVTHCIALNTKGITSSGTIYRVSSIAGTDNYASPLIDGTWADKGADKPNGADLTDENFINVTGANGAFTGWTDTNWDFTDNTKLPKLKGFNGTQPADSITRESVMRKPLITTIASAEDLVAFREAVNNDADYAGKTVTLTADITVTGWTTGIGIKAAQNDNNKPFLGTFDGQGYTITLEGSASLFAVIGKADNLGGIVQNLGVNATITANANYVGGIVGYSLGTVRNCYTEGAITNESFYTGGIIGENGGTIQNCYSTALCTGNNNTGGIVGKNSGTIQQCYATGAITGESAGGIAGTFGGSITLKNSIALNTNITGNSTIRRVGAGSLSGNYASPLIPGTWTDKGADKADGEDLTDENFTNVTTATGAFANWPTDGANDWDFGNNTYLPKLKGFSTQPADGITRESVMRKPLITTIASKEDLVAFRDAVNNGADYAGKTVTLTADITVTGWTTGIGILTNNQNDNKPFLGIFDGQGHTITLSGSANLFAMIGETGTVQNLGVKATIAGNISYSFGGIGGIAGYNYGTVQNCYTEGSLTNESNYTGGIVAYNTTQGTIRNCYSTASCTANNIAGGIAGQNSGTIQQCYATGAITGGAEYSAGGIAGSFSGSPTLKNCIALNMGGITAFTKRRVGGGSTLSGNFGSPLIPGEWTDKGADKENGADLTEANFIGTEAGAGAFTDWQTAVWDFSDNTALPKLKTTGLTSDKVINGQGDGSGNMPTRADFLELPIEISTAVSYEAATHKDKDIVIKDGGIFTIATDNASLKKLTIEEGGQVITQKAFTVKELAHPITLGNKWTAYGSPVNMNAVATSQTIYQLNGYSQPDAQFWNTRGDGSGTLLIQNRSLIATEAIGVSATLSAPTSGSALVTIPADAAAPTGEALYTGIFLFHANPTLKEVTIPVAYILSDDGTRFERTDNAVVKPFQSYMVANAVTSAAVMELRSGGIPTANEPVALPDNTFRVWAADGQLHLDASKPADISIYNTAGQLVRRLALTGQQTVSLPRGIYFVHSNNITYKVSL